MKTPGSNFMKTKIVRTNITIPEDILFFLKKVAFAKKSSVSEEIRKMVIYTREISYWGELEINKMFREDL